MATVTRIPRPPTRTRFLPRDPRVEGPYRMTPQIALRLGILGAVLLFVFAVLFFRLWALQVLAGERYLVAAQNNQLRTIRIEAPRGPLRDHRGRTIVGNKEAMNVQVWPASLPRCRRPGVFRKLARVLGVSVAELQSTFRSEVIFASLGMPPMSKRSVSPSFRPSVVAMPSSTLTAQSTRVSPNDARQEPSA